MKYTLSEFQQRDVGKYLHLISNMAAFLSRKSIQNAEYSVFSDGLKDLQRLLDNLHEILAGERVMSEADNKRADHYSEMRNKGEPYFGDIFQAPNEKKGKK